MKSEITLNESVKEAIEIALIKLLKKKDINKITVTELTELAGVGRSSFYRNFNSFEDVAAGYMNRIYREYFKEKPANPEVLKKKHFEIVMKERYAFIKRNKEFFNAVNKNGMLYNLLCRMDDDVQKSFLFVDISESKYFNAMFMGFLAGVMGEWISGEMKESESEMARITKACLLGIVDTFKDAF